MLTELNERLTEIASARRERQRLDRLIGAADARLKTERALLATLRQELDKAAAAVARLEGRGLAGLFYAVLGEREMRFKQERERFLGAQLRHDESEHAVWALEKELEELRARRAPLEGLDGDYEAALAEKERLLAAGHDRTSQQLLRLAEGLAETRAEEKELGEAIRAGKELLAGLGEVVESLRGAQSWGTFDMIGGGIVATAVKHQRIDKARAQMHAVQAQLSRFQRELADVMLHGPVADEISSFDVTADYLFDGLIVDWIVQSKINRSLESVLRVQERAHAIVTTLREDLVEVKERAAYLGRERQSVIEGA